MSKKQEKRIKSTSAPIDAKKASKPSTKPPTNTGSKRSKKEASKVLYVIKDKHLPDGEVKILKSANAWWIDRIKVQSMIDGLKMGAKWGEIQHLCGITETQRKYFFKVHEGLLLAFESLPENQTLLARQSLNKKLEAGNWDATKFYLERKLPEEFKEKKDVSAEIILIEDLIT